MVRDAADAGWLGGDPALTAALFADIPVEVDRRDGAVEAVCGEQGEAAPVGESGDEDAGERLAL